MRLRRDINARLSQEPTIFQRNRLTALLVDINGLATAAFGDISTQSIYGAQQLAATEASFSVKLFNKATTVDAGWTLPASGQLVAAVAGSHMATGVNSSITMEDAFRAFGAAKTKQIGQIISDGVTLGDTTATISGKVSQTINTLTRRQLDSLVRTVTNHAASVARGQVYEANSDLLEGYQWVATLDGRTTLICGSRDGEVYIVGVGPMPPAHWGCRSTTIPKLKPEYDVGAEIGGKRSARSADGSREESANITYGGWLRKQPPEFVDEALGVERSRLFRAGKLPIDKFVDPTGRVYTLAQLERMNPIAFIE